MPTKLLLPVFLFVVSVFFTDNYLRHSTNVLYMHPDWVSAKSLIPNGLVTAQEFVFERQTLAHHRLNLGEWNGFNEVLWKKSQDFKDLSFNLTLTENSYLWIIFSQIKTERFAFRLSRFDKFKSGFYVINEDREFGSHIGFDYNPINGETIRLTNNDGTVRLTAGEKLLFEKKMNLHPLVSFRSGLNKVTIENAKSDTNYEDFSPPFDFRILLFSLIINGLMLWGFYRLEKMAAFSLQLSWLILIGGITFVDRAIWSADYYEPAFIGINQSPVAGITTSLERARRVIILQVFRIVGDSQRQQVLEDKNFMYHFFIPENALALEGAAKEIYHPNGLEDNSARIRRQFINNSGHVEFLEEEKDLESKNDNSFKIGFFGSSETFGGGELEPDRGFASMTIARLNRLAKKNITGYNFSRPGEDSGQLLEIYRAVLEHWKPDLLVVNLAHNDANLDRYKKNMIKLSELNKKLGIKTAYVLEPNTSELGFVPLKEKHDFLRTLDPNVLDLQTLLSTPPYFDSGFIWWDVVHFDQAGHNAVAKELTEFLFRSVK